MPAQVIYRDYRPSWRRRLIRKLLVWIVISIAVTVTAMGSGIIWLGWLK